MKHKLRLLRQKLRLALYPAEQAVQFTWSKAAYSISISQQRYHLNAPLQAYPNHAESQQKLVARPHGPQRHQSSLL